MLGAPSPSCPPTTNLSSDSCSGDPADPGCARAKAQKSRNMLVNIAGKGEPLGADRGGVQGRSGRHRLGCGHRRFRNHHLPVAGGPEILSRGQVMAGTVETPPPSLSPQARRLWQAGEAMAARQRAAGELSPPPHGSHTLVPLHLPNMECACARFKSSCSRASSMY
jgi:hypothetical protein